LSVPGAALLGQSRHPPWQSPLQAIAFGRSPGLAHGARAEPLPAPDRPFSYSPSTRPRFTGPDLAQAPVAQLDRAPDYESGGQEFESLRARHQVPTIACILAIQLAAASTALAGGSNMEARACPNQVLFAYREDKMRAPAAQTSQGASLAIPATLRGLASQRDLANTVSAISLAARVPSSRAGEALTTRNLVLCVERGNRAGLFHKSAHPEGAPFAQGSRSVVDYSPGPKKLRHGAGPQPREGVPRRVSGQGRGGGVGSSRDPRDM
jgi:hypothetical protein